PVAPLGPAAVWNGSQLIEWGGGVSVNEGRMDSSSLASSYDPAADRWQAIPASPARSDYPAAVWSGTDVVSYAPFFVTAGKMAVNETDTFDYEPTTRRWYRLPSSGLSARTGPRLVWTGSQILIWGGGTDGKAFADGAAFTPS